MKKYTLVFTIYNIKYVYITNQWIIREKTKKKIII